MTPLCRRMIEAMRVHSLAANTQRAYLQQISNFARHFGRSPELLGAWPRRRAIANRKLFMCSLESHSLIAKDSGRRNST
jgi:hypothetical protein